MRATLFFTVLLGALFGFAASSPAATEAPVVRAHSVAVVAVPESTPVVVAPDPMPVVVAQPAAPQQTQAPAAPIVAPVIQPSAPWMPALATDHEPAAPTMGQWICWNDHGYPLGQTTPTCPEGWGGRPPENPLPVG
jgi:hypothetical protein